MNSGPLDPNDPLLRPLTIKQAMELTGRGKRTIDRWIQQGRLRKVRLGGDPPEEVLIEREVLDAERATRRAARQGRPRPKAAQAVEATADPDCDTAPTKAPDTPSIPQIGGVDAGS
jgi:excisionase family DNA binding protein